MEIFLTNLEKSFFTLLRYLVWMEIFLTNLEKTHPGAKELLSKGGIAVARSLVPGALSAVDKTMEETFMRFAKSTGIVNLCNFSMQVRRLYKYLGNYVYNNFLFKRLFWTVQSVWNLQKVVPHHLCTSQFYEKTLQMTDLVSDPDNPRSNRTVNWKRQRSRRVNGLLYVLLMQLKASPILSISLTKISYTAWLLVPRFRPMLKQMFFRQKLSVTLPRWNSTKAFKMVTQIVSSTQKRRKNSKPWKLAVKR